MSKKRLRRVVSSSDESSSQEGSPQSLSESDDSLLGESAFNRRGRGPPSAKRPKVDSSAAPRRRSRRSRSPPSSSSDDSDSRDESLSSSSSGSLVVRKPSRRRAASAPARRAPARRPSATVDGYEDDGFVVADESDEYEDESSSARSSESESESESAVDSDESDPRARRNSRNFRGRSPAGGKRRRVMALSDSDESEAAVTASSDEDSDSSSLGGAGGHAALLAQQRKEDEELTFAESKGHFLAETLAELPTSTSRLRKRFLDKGKLTDDLLLPALPIGDISDTFPLQRQCAARALYIASISTALFDSRHRALDEGGREIAAAAECYPDYSDVLEGGQETGGAPALLLALLGDSRVRRRLSSPDGIADQTNMNNVEGRSLARATAALAGSTLTGEPVPPSKQLDFMRAIARSSLSVSRNILLDKHVCPAINKTFFRRQWGQSTARERFPELRIDKDRNMRLLRAATKRLMSVVPLSGVEASRVADWQDDLESAEHRRISGREEQLYWEEHPQERMLFSRVMCGVCEEWQSSRSMNHALVDLAFLVRVRIDNPDTHEDVFRYDADAQPDPEDDGVGKARAARMRKGIKDFVATMTPRSPRSPRSPRRAHLIMSDEEQEEPRHKYKRNESSESSEPSGESLGSSLDETNSSDEERTAYARSTPTASQGRDRRASGGESSAGAPGARRSRRIEVHGTTYEVVRACRTCGVALQRAVQLLDFLVTWTQCPLPALNLSSDDTQLLSQLAAAAILMFTSECRTTQGDKLTLV